MPTLIQGPTPTAFLLISAASVISTVSGSNMSVFPEDMDVLQIAEQVYGFQISRYIEISVLIFFLYDSILCIAQEIDLVWTRSFRYMTLLYFITRHMMLVSLIIDAIYNQKQPQCSPLEHLSDVCKILANASTLVLLVVCSWAMFDRSKILLTLFGSCALTLEGVYGASTVFNRCAANSYVSKTAFLWNISSTISEYAFDSVVMFLVLYNAFCALVFEKSIKALRRRTLANLILHDGLTYYGSLLVVSLAHILLAFTGNLWVKNAAHTLIQPMSAVITARFLLNMRYMEVYPNGTTMVALTTLGIVIESPVSDSDITSKDDGQYYIYGRDSTDSLTDGLPSYNNSMALASDIRVFDCDVENILPIPPMAALAPSTTVVDIRDILEDTFWV